MTQTKSKEEFVHGVFESIAPKYDMMNDLLSFRRHKAWRRFAMRRMKVRPGQTAIDVACGTGDWTLSIAEASRTGQVIGLDFSRNMLAVGERKIAAAGRQKQVQLVQGNAMSLPYEDNRFDYATIGFALRNVPDIEKVLGEMLRVVKPGGMVVSLELSKPAWQPFKSLYFFYFQRLLPWIGKIAAKSYEQYKWLPQSLIHFPDHKQLADIFCRLGMQEVKAYPLTGGIAALHVGRKAQTGEDA